MTNEQQRVEERTLIKDNLIRAVNLIEARAYSEHLDAGEQEAIKLCVNGMRHVVDGMTELKNR